MNKATLQCCLSQAWGGLEMVAFETATKMKENGLQVTTVCLPGSPLQNKLVEAGLPTIGVERPRRYFAPKVVSTIRRALRSGQYSSVLVQQTTDLWQVVPALWGMRDVKLVTISHSFLAISKRDILHTWIYGRINSLVALTELHKRNLTDRLPVSSDNIAVLPNTVDLERFNPSRRTEAIRQQYLREESEILIGVVSRLDIGKGILETLAAAEQLRDWKVKFQLVFFGKETVGQSGMKTRLEEEIQTRGLRSHVQLAGHRTDIEAVIASLDVLLMPSPAETFGRVLIEAMASGTPVVASSGGGVSNIIDHGVNGLLVKPLDAQDMATSLRSYYDNPKKRQQIAANGIRIVDELYDYRKVDRKLYGLLGLV